MCSPAATRETTTVVIDRLNVISSGSVVYMKIDAKFGNDPAISSGVISFCVFGFGPLVAKPRIRQDRNFV
jgi:hypothetical protein